MYSPTIFIKTELYRYYYICSAAAAMKPSPLPLSLLLWLCQCSRTSCCALYWIHLVFQVIIPFMLRKWNVLIFAKHICKMNQSTIMPQQSRMVCWLSFSSSPHFDLDINICFWLSNVTGLLLDVGAGKACDWTSCLVVSVRQPQHCFIIVERKHFSGSVCAPLK